MNEQRVALTKRMRFNVFKRDAFTCQYCGSHPPSVVLEVDHINPVANGGKNNIDNLITACFDCNRGKSDRLLEILPQTLEQKADVLREKQEQMKAYERLLKTEKRNEDKRIDEVQDAFKLHFSGFSFSDSFRASVRIFVQKMPVNEVVAAMHRACSKIGRRDDSIKYFCGICWKTIRGDNSQHRGFKP
jgi:hypothetical protein